MSAARLGVSNFAQTPLGQCAYNTLSQTGATPNENQLGSRKTLFVDRSGWSSCRYVPALVRFRLHEPECGRKIGKHEFLNGGHRCACARLPKQVRCTAARCRTTS